MPAFHLFNSGGKMRHFQAGDRGFDRLLDRIGRVVDENAATKSQ